MTQRRHVLPISLDDELIADIHYACNTSGDNRKLSKEIEKILRQAIPSRRLSISMSH